MTGCRAKRCGSRGVDGDQARATAGADNPFMEILYLLVPLGVLTALAIGGAFWMAVAGGQFDDLDRPARELLAGDDQ